MRLVSANTIRVSRPASAAVEFAVVAPILALLVLGMIEVTRAIQVKNVLTDTARSGCRIGIQAGATSDNVKDSINSILTSNGIDSSFATITILVNNANVNVSTATRYETISVKIALPISKVNWVTPLFFASTSVESEMLVMMHQ
jgi:Flp pilus assembly protein TadG